jgi:hypothetical protein
VLASMVDLSQDELAAASPWFGLVDHLGGRHDETLICFSLRRDCVGAGAAPGRMPRRRGRATDRPTRGGRHRAAHPPPRVRPLRRSLAGAAPGALDGGAGAGCGRAHGPRRALASRPWPAARRSSSRSPVARCG